MKAAHRRRIPRDYQPLVRKAIDAGWRVVHRRRHVQLYSPHGVIVCLSATPSDWRGLANLRAQLCRAGVSV